jgi:sec-independent protein translocase protein TatA
MGWDAPWHWVVLALVVIALFGYKRLPDASRALGRSLRIFKTELKGMAGDDAARAAAPPAEIAPAPPAAAPPAAVAPQPVAVAPQPVAVAPQPVAPPVSADPAVQPAAEDPATPSS